jgi:hypothetical protein
LDLWAYQADKAIRGRGMSGTDRHFGYDLPANELDPVILVENPLFNHLVVLIDRKAERRRFGNH